MSRVNLRQLRYVLEVHRRGNHISAAAEALHTSQPGMSKQIQLLEEELGFAVFQRKRNRVVVTAYQYRFLCIVLIEACR